MVEITLTIIVQALHFFIAYVLLRYIFLQPALALILKRDGSKLGLKKSIQVARKRVEHQQKIRDDRYALCQKTFWEACTAIQEVLRSYSQRPVESIDPVSIVLDPDTLQRKQQEARRTLVKALEEYE